MTCKRHSLKDNSDGNTFTNEYYNHLFGELLKVRSLENGVKFYFNNKRKVIFESYAVRITLIQSSFFSDTVDISTIVLV